MKYKLKIKYWTYHYGIEHNGLLKGYGSKTVIAKDFDDLKRKARDDQKKYNSSHKKYKMYISALDTFGLNVRIKDRFNNVKSR